MTDTVSKFPRRDIRLAMTVFGDLLPAQELQHFRGAMIKIAENHPLFHNHAGEGYEYRYPRIQYKLFDGHPAVLGIEEGATLLKDIFSSGQTIRCRIGRHDTSLTVASLGEWQEEIGMSDAAHTYAIENWLPLNEGNFRQFRQAEGMISRIDLLQRIMVGNILSFAKGMDLYFDSEVKCLIQQLKEKPAMTYKGVGLLEFSASFTTNILLPQWIGLGKSASQNHGIIIHL